MELRGLNNGVMKRFRIRGPVWSEIIWTVVFKWPWPGFPKKRVLCGSGVWKRLMNGVFGA